jgi:membrane protein DedA with SNARE-associated domain
MKNERFSLFTAITTALAAAALFMLPYEFGLLPGGAFEDSSIGPVPVWALCLALILLLLAVSIGTIMRIRRRKISASRGRG